MVIASCGQLLDDVPCLSRSEILEIERIGAATCRE